MKRILIAFFALFALLSTGVAQPDVEERIKQAREDFFTKALQLTPQESKDFWPLYYQYQDDEKDLENQYRPHGKIELMSDQEVEQYIENTFTLKEKQLALQRSYFQKMRTVLPIRKVAMLNKTEKQFKRKLLERVQNRRRQNNKRQKRK